MLILGVIGGVLYLLTGIPEGIIDIARFSDELEAFGVPVISNMTYVIVKVLSILASVSLMLAFVHIADKNKQILMQVGAYAVLVVCVAVGLVDILTLNLNASEDSLGLIIMVELIMYALSGIIFGVGVLLSRRKLGDIAWVVGILEIGVGVSLGSFFLAFLAVVLIIPATILEILLIVKLYKKT